MHHCTALKMSALTHVQALGTGAFSAHRPQAHFRLRHGVARPRSCRAAALFPNVPSTSRHSSSVLVRSSADADVLSQEAESVETAKEAIELGNQFGKQGRWAEALAVYEKALTLPGTGQKRYRDKPRLISDGEKQAALYNIACCHSQLQDSRSGLVALSGALELGYDGFAQLRKDPDLSFLRTDERFEGLLTRFEPRAGGLFNIFGGGGSK